MRNISELRQDLVTGDWVVVATGRAHRPNEFVKHRVLERPQPKSSCPFEELLPDAFLVYDRGGESFRSTPQDRAYLKRNWWLQVVPNKYPAFGRGVSGVERKIGPYLWQDGVGFHEVVVTADHTRSIARMSSSEVETIVSSYRERYLALKSERCVEYISIFHNHGREAGASILHPHSQIIAIPVIPPDVGSSLRGSTDFYHRTKKCVHCTMLAAELRARTRMVYQNSDFTVYCPFASRQAFEVRIFPTRHVPEFETSNDRELAGLADALRATLAKLFRGLRDPAYNFFIHTAPTSRLRHVAHYHWHMEIIPKTAIWAGFEIGTGIEISTIAPEQAAKFLRGIEV